MKSLDQVRLTTIPLVCATPAPQITPLSLGSWPLAGSVEACLPQGREKYSHTAYSHRPVLCASTTKRISTIIQTWEFRILPYRRRKENSRSANPQLAGQQSLDGPTSRYPVRVLAVSATHGTECRLPMHLCPSCATFFGGLKNILRSPYVPYSIYD